MPEHQPLISYVRVQWDSLDVIAARSPWARSTVARGLRRLQKAGAVDGRIVVIGHGRLAKEYRWAEKPKLAGFRRAKVAGRRGYIDLCPRCKSLPKYRSTQEVMRRAEITLALQWDGGSGRTNRIRRAQVQVDGFHVGEIVYAGGGGGFYINPEPRPARMQSKMSTSLENALSELLRHSENHNHFMYLVPGAPWPAPRLDPRSTR